MNLSPHFTLVELTRSQTAIRHSIDNTPSPIEIENLRNLCVNLLEPLRDLVGKPISISSGYRCRTLNSLVGGSATSQHIQGKAADLSVEGYTTEELFNKIKNSNLQFDQLIQEFDSWVHISYSSKKTNRFQILRATKSKGKTKYTKG